ncbi:MAG: hypothetical protein HY701_14960 [Gemmatimonadetes bacterium]|nr:hypothetical protein [Gemmatimonadota bacterium]
MRASWRLWLSAGVAAGILAALTAAAVPLVMRLELRDSSMVWVLLAEELWLLAVFTEGVVAVLLGAAAFAGWFSGRGVRDAADASTAAHGGTPATTDPDRDASPAWWTFAVGGWLLGIYFVGWLVQR